MIQNVIAKENGSNGQQKTMRPFLSKINPE